MTTSSQYEDLGVDAHKTAVRKIFTRGVVDNDFPGAWVNSIRDSMLPGYATTQHMDGDGSKSVQRLLMYQITGNPAHLAGMVDDAVSMNTGDVAAAGYVYWQTWTDVWNLNSFNVDKEVVLEQICARFESLRALYREYGIEVYWLGGETGDLPHQVHSAVFDVTVNARAPIADLITGNVVPGDKIWGFKSDGKAAWELERNSGIMSNGLTLGRVALMHASYPTRHPAHVLHGTAYKGRFSATTSIGEALISPTRQWAILIKILIDILKAHDALHLLHGISMNTGGGATKVKNLGTGGICYHKKMPRAPAIFELIQEESEETWENMYTTFNCGIGLDIAGDQALGEYLVQTALDTEVALVELGHCSAHDGDPSRNTVSLVTPYGAYPY